MNTGSDKLVQTPDPDPEDVDTCNRLFKSLQVSSNVISKKQVAHKAYKKPVKNRFNFETGDLEEFFRKKQLVRNQYFKKE